MTLLVTLLAELGHGQLDGHSFAESAARWPRCKAKVFSFTDLHSMLQLVCARYGSQMHVFYHQWLVITMTL